MAMKPQIFIAALVLGAIAGPPAYAQFQDRDRSEMMRRQSVAINDASNEAVPAEDLVVQVPLPRARPRFVMIPLPRPAPDRATSAIVSPSIEVPEAVVNIPGGEASGPAELTGVPLLRRGADAGSRGPVASPQPARLLAPLLSN
jgi:hypothetical protein